jgi:hypothetical protein
MSANATGRTEKRVHAPRVSRKSRSGGPAETEYVDPRPSAAAADWSWRSATVLRDNRRSTFPG